MNNSPHDTPEDSRGDSPEAANDPLESAVSHLKRSARTTGEEPFEQRSQAALTQREALVALAESQGLILDPSGWLRGTTTGGAEHDIVLHEKSGEYWKVTRPDHFGWTVLPGEDGAPVASEATPLEYLERWLNANEIFGDAAKLRGVIVTEQGVQVVISQPFIKGPYPSLSEIKVQMAAGGFDPVVGFHLGAEVNTSYYHPGEKVGVFDAAPDNFILSHKMAVPIDVVTIRVSDALHVQLRRRMKSRGAAPPRR